MRETIVTANRCLQNGRKSESATLQTGATYSEFTENFSEIYSEIKCQTKKNLSINKWTNEENRHLVIKET